MAFILTFLGKGGVGRSTVAIAAAKKYAQAGKRVLLIGQDPSPAWGIALGMSPSFSPVNLENNLDAVQIMATAALESSWEQAKALEAKYLRSPTLKNVYGQELGILPGMDSAVILKEIWDYDKSGQYDVIIFDGDGDLNTLRLLGTPEILSWYIRRFREVFQASDLGRAISPFIQPVTSAILNVSWTFDNFAAEPTQEANQVLDEGKKAMADPNRFAAYLVTDASAGAIAKAKYLWGSAQQVNVTVGGVIVNRSDADIGPEFEPLMNTALPTVEADHWDDLISHLPDFSQAAQAPRPLIIDTAARQVKVFLPTFDKKQVKLTQYGPEITIEAGDQRRNILLPPPLKGAPVKGAKFQNQYLIISL
ncbi:Get3/ArsA fold putative tail anchor-mediating ATPase NosAFP [Picosynechococcus sp. PCC 73109]|uniref:Get3/ArsA fold putative tail anchor-mediating ATPase NosAFP n=1 Tax=Picosynechococcus sp. PCC 73109 TaxID=374982 RepID=UPI0007458F3B|nr:ArsA family ATPase [Picosynechococcus sp. PCC 73109]AMA08752.1 arsenic-transporting ATPase [Picosynechococcus sp. PCC 73109]